MLEYDPYCDGEHIYAEQATSTQSYIYAMAMPIWSMAATID